MGSTTGSRLENLWTRIALHALRFAAHRRKMSVEDLAEEVLARDAPATQEAGPGRDRSQQLDGILKRLSSYRGEDLDADIAAFAHAEATEEDPLTARRVIPDDIHGVGAAFGDRLGRRSI